MPVFVNGSWLRRHILVNPKKSCDSNKASCVTYIPIPVSSHVPSILRAFCMTLMIYNQNGMLYNPGSVIQDMKVYALHRWDLTVARAMET